MGLDMTLEKYPKVAGVPLEALIRIDIDELNADIKHAFAPYIKLRGTSFQWETFSEEVMYWRKANAIHKFFVDNVQNGEDDCGYYKVSLDVIKQLYNLCLETHKVITNSPKKTISVHVGWNKSADIYEDVSVYDVDEYVMEELLPTTSGFFFGSTDYGEWYLENLTNTIEICEKIINEFDFDKYDLVYTSSW